MSRNSGSSVSGLVIVLTLPVNEREGLRPYLSQSEYPAKGTTVGGRTDDPRRERTRDAPARHRARAGARQRQPGVPRTGDLPDGVLSLAQTLGTLRGRRRARYGRTRHVAATEPGELVCLDTFYIGNLKGIGKVWQITACDAATSYGLASLLPAHDALAAAAFLREVVVPHYQRAGWPVRRVLTDGGPEFKGAFDAACRQLHIRHTRTKPRHAWTNGFVERLQGTILQEHWRVAFRRHYFTSRRALQRALDGFMRHYNIERPHQGYRLRGRTPAALVWGVAAQAQ